MASFSKALRPSFFPLLLSGAAFLTQTALKACFNNPNLSMDSPSQVNSDLFDPIRPSGRLVETPEPANIGVFGDYLTFMVLSVIFNLMMMLFVKVKENNFNGKHDKFPSQGIRRVTDDELTSFEITCGHQPDHFVIKLIKLIQPLIKGVLCYTLVFCFFKLALFCAFAFETSEKISLQPRILQESQDTSAVFDLPQTPEKVSLAMGRILASFDVESTMVAMSQDEKWVYASAKNPQFVRVYDTSDWKAPKQVAMVNLGKLSRTRVCFQLSADGKLLIASNYVDVIMIDVSNPRSPHIIGSFESPMYASSDGMVLVTMAISLDNKYLFMAQVGFAVLDISNPSNISMIYTSVERTPTGTGYLASLWASKDRKLLYLANGKGALEVYNMTNPDHPLLVNHFNFTNSTAHSIHLSKDDNRAYIAGISRTNLAINVLDISSPLEIKQLSAFQVTASINGPPVIQALSPRETKIYIVQQRLMTIDLISTAEEDSSGGLVQGFLLSICFSSSGRYAGVAYLEQLVFIELFTDFPNTRIFTPSNSSDGSFFMDKRFDSWAVTHGGKVLFAAFNDYERLNSCFEIWNIKKRDAPNRIVSLNATQLGVNLTAPFLSFKMSPDNKRAYLKWWTKESSKLIILDVSGNLKRPTKLKEYTVPLSLNFEDFAFSNNEKILCIAPDPSTITLYDLQDPKQNQISLPEHSDLKSNNSDLEFAKNDTILMIITSKISLYNVSNLSNPKFLGSISLTEGGSPRILSTTVLEEEDCLIVEWYQTSRKLRVYNLSDILAPTLISELALPKRTFNDAQDILSEFYGPFVYCESQKLGFVGTNGTLLRIDLSDLKNPMISGVVPVTTCKACGGTSRFVISPDGKTALATNQVGMLKTLKVINHTIDLYNGRDMSSQIFATDLQIQSSLYIPKEKFLLGERYSDNVFILNNAGKQRYEVAWKTVHKILKLYLYDVKVVSSQLTPQITSSSLPDWMKFHQDTHLLTLEAKSKKDLGVYTICADISEKVSQDALNNTGPFAENEITMTLISLGYMDPEFYLTTTFGTRSNFFLPKKFAQYQDQIYDILSSSFIEDCTKIEILPSLEVSVLQPLNRIWINTTSTEAMKVDITLLPNKKNQIAQFLSKTYGPLIPEIRSQKSRIVLEGSLNEIHTALQNVVINANNGTSYDGIVSITDGLNYPIEKRIINNISNCFLKNSPPFENPNATRTFQAQLDRVSVATGQYLNILWDEATFKDEYADVLSYDIVIDNDANPGKPKAFPDWLSFHNLALRGTPPEKLSDREIPLKFIVKNEFQNITIPFKLNIGISPTFAISLLVKYSPYLLTALGLYIKANKIYNIVAKKRYKHSKEYQVQEGEEISILPVLFIEEELKESQLIMKLLKKNRLELVSYFIDKESRTLNKDKLIQSINQVVSDLSVKEKERLPLYLEGSDFHRKKITQIIINQIVMLQLDSSQEKSTKRVFENMKNQWADLVEWDSELLFVVNKGKLSKILNNLSLKTEEENSSLLLGEYREQINQDLLQEALISHTFYHQSVDARSTMVLIEAHEKFKRNKMQAFLKKDLEGSHLNSQSAVEYGFYWKLKNDMLVFSGAPNENFKGKTLAIQIQTVQWRILKEIWIQESSAQIGSSTIEMSSRHESSLRGNAYEVY